MNKTLPPKFYEQIAKQLGAESRNFFNSFMRPIPVSIRWNRLKIPKNHLVADPVPWCKYGEYLNKRPVFTLDPSFHAGAYYPQEASSMILWSVLDQLQLEVEPICILDLCAAPGGKSTLIADYFSEDTVIICNEVIKNRCSILAENIMKWSRTNFILTNNDPRDFQKSQALFDLIVIDAPCSGEGMFRKDPAAIEEWSEQKVMLCAARQNRIVHDILPCLKPGGMIIYSTCTFNESENINNVLKWSRDFDLHSVRLHFDQSYGITEMDKSGVYGYQLYPHLVRGEGFFISVLKSNSNLPTLDKYSPFSIESINKKERKMISHWIRQKDDSCILKAKNGHLELVSNNAANLLTKHGMKWRILSKGLNIGKLNKDVFTPSHGLALSSLLAESIPSYELDLKDSLKYLSKKPFRIPFDTPKGWIKITYRENGIGWIKKIDNRYNNYLPNELIIKSKELIRAYEEDL